jgi:3-oxoacyl-[acyl-carrier protein] reductase
MSLAQVAYSQPGVCSMHRYQPESFAGRAAVVTGAGSGIGRASALRLALEGASVLAVDKDAVGLQETVGATESGSGSIESLVADVVPADAAGEIVDACMAHFGRLDFLVNNAGIGGRTTIADVNDDTWDTFIETNLSAVMRLCRAALPIITAPGGRIVNVSSVFGLVGFPASAAYGVTKAGVAQLTRQLAADQSSRGVLVNAVAPGVIRTAMTEARIDGSDWYKTAMIDPTPVGRVGEPEDVAGVVAFLCSRDAAFISGQILTVDGGWLATRYLPPE